MDSAAIRALRIAELLRTIFLYLYDDLDLEEDSQERVLNAACVCKCWSGVALDVLWEQMNLKDFLLALAPTREVDVLEGDEEYDDNDEKRVCRQIAA